MCYNIITYKLDQFKEAGQQRDHEKTVVGGIMDTENEPKSLEFRVDELEKEVKRLANEVRRASSVCRRLETEVRQIAARR